MAQLSILMTVDLISVILGLATIYYIYKIGRITGWFGAWTLIALAFVGLTIRRMISAGLIGGTVAGIGVEHWSQFINSILFFAGFYMLHKLFKESRKR